MNIKSIQDMNKKVTRCKCGLPLVKKLDSKRFEIAKSRKEKAIIEYTNDSTVVTCGNCGNKTTFKTGEVALGLSYAIAKKNN